MPANRNVKIVLTADGGALVLPGQATLGVDVQLRHVDGTMEWITKRPQIVLQQEPNGTVTVSHMDTGLNIEWVRR